MTENTRVAFDDLTVEDDGLTTWRGQPFTGTAVETFADGSPMTDMPFVDGVVHGVTQTWDQAGNLRTRENSWLGTHHGVMEEWDEQGELALRRTYELGTLVGEMKWDQGVLTRDWQLGAEEESFQRLQQMRSRWGSEFPPM